jgi:hypothetical protein
METPFKISYRWNADEMLLLNRLHVRYSPQLRKLHRSSRIGAVIFIFMGILCFCVMGATTDKWRAAMYGCGLVLVGVALLTVPPVFMRRVVLKAYAKKPDRDMAVTYLISGERLLCKSDVASSDMLWQVVARVLRTADGFLLYVSDAQVHWLPLRGFEDPADADRFAALARSKVQSYKDER